MLSHQSFQEIHIIADEGFELDDVIRMKDNVLVKKELEKLRLSINEMNELLSILCDIANNTRRWENYGHTPVEMIKIKRC